MIEIHGRKVGPGQPCYIVAEIGINHGGDTALAVQMIQAAKDAGCDAIKVQNYKTDSFIHQRSEFWTYKNNGVEICERQEDMFRRCELDKAKLRWLKNHADRIGIEMFSTPMCIEGLQDCYDLGFPILKNGSDCLRDLDLIRAMGETGLPTIISMGMATEEEKDSAVDTFKESGNDKLIVMHCCSAYPAPDDSMNICRMTQLGHLFDCPVGLSDHSEGITAAVLSLAYECCMIEKHFTLDKNMDGPDHSFSADPSEMAALVAAVRKAEKQIGSYGFEMSDVEKQNRKEWFK